MDNNEYLKKGYVAGGFCPRFPFLLIGAACNKHDSKPVISGDGNSDDKPHLVADYEKEIDKESLFHLRGSFNKK